MRNNIIGLSSDFHVTVCLHGRHQNVENVKCPKYSGTQNLAEHVQSSTTNAEVTLEIYCDVAWSGSFETAVCHNLTIESGHSKYITLALEGDLTDSTFNFSDPSLLEITINLTRMGTIKGSSIYAPNVQNLFEIHSNSTLGIINSFIRGPDINTQSAAEMRTKYPSHILNSTFEGRLDISGGGIFADSTFGAATTGSMSITLNENGVWIHNDVLIENAKASLTFNGRTSGYVYAKSSPFLNVICKSYDPSQSCDGLILDVPPYELVNGTDIKKSFAFLECMDYGCTNITVLAENGIDDIAVTAVHCDCGPHGANGESGDSCIGLMNIKCDNGEATFDGETCDGVAECCGMIEQETHAAVCSATDASSGLSNGEVVGVLIGVIFAILLVTSLACYCSNQQSIRYQIERTEKSNPYTQPIAKDNKVTLESAAGSRTKTVNATQSGYGAISDNESASDL